MIICHGSECPREYTICCESCYFKYECRNACKDTATCKNQEEIDEWGERDVSKEFRWNIQRTSWRGV